MNYKIKYIYMLITSLVSESLKLLKKSCCYSVKYAFKGCCVKDVSF